MLCGLTVSKSEIPKLKPTVHRELILGWSQKLEPISKFIVFIYYWYICICKK